MALIKILDEEEFFAHDEIIADEYASDGAEKTGVADEPAENVTSVVRHQFPRLHDDAHGASDQAAGAETDAARRKIREIVGGRDDVGGDVDVERGHQQSDHGQDQRPRIAEAREDRNRIPQGPAKNNQGGGGNGDADERIKSHRCGEAERLADDLIALAASVAREIRNVQRDGGPEADHAGERRNEEPEEFTEGLKFRRRGEHGAEAARFAARPKKNRKPDDKHIQKPEKEKADRRAGMKIRPAWREGHDHGVDGFATDPGLNAKPAAGDEGAQNGGNICAQNTK